MVTTIKVVGPLLVLAMLAVALIASYQPRQPKPGITPSRLEKTCAYRGAWVPCFIVDEALQPQWNV